MRIYIFLYFIFVLSKSSLVRKLNSSTSSDINEIEITVKYNKETNTIIYNDQVYKFKTSESGEHHEVDLSELPTDYIIWNSIIILCKYLIKFSINTFCRVDVRFDSRIFINR